MLDPRIYRTCLVAVAVALIVVAFSLQDQRGPLSTSLVPDAFNGQDAYADMQSLAQAYPERRPGTAGDDALATVVAQRLSGQGYQVSTRAESARTVDGARTLVTVTATRPGLQSGSIVILSSRDAAGSPAVSQLSGTAVMLELGRVLAGETQQHSIVLMSTSGTVGAGAVSRLAAELPAPVQEVIVLGDLAAARVERPVVLPFSSRAGFAPTQLRNTLAAAIGTEAGLRSGGITLGDQLARLAVPLTTSQEAPFNAAGEPAVEVTLDGERGPARPAPAASEDQLAGMGRAMLRSVDALDAAGPQAVVQPYLLSKGKVVPAWAIRLLVLALMVPVIAVTLDGTARAHRRGFSVAAWLGVVLSRALPAAAGLAMLLLARVSGLLPAPPGLPPAGAVPFGFSGALALLATGMALLVSGILVHRLVPLPAALLPSDVDSVRSARTRGARTRGGGTPSPGRPRRGTGRPSGAWRNPGATAALLIVLCGTTTVIWVSNPFAALLVVPATHLWAWGLDPDLEWPRPLRIALWVGGLVAPALVVLEYALVLGQGPGQMVWDGAQVLAGGGIRLPVLVEWCLLAGCSAGAAAALAARATLSHPRPARISVRGPASYAGPGSLGGTESALRR